MTPAIVLCISGHDPSGGAGLQADIETVRACGGYANTVPTCLTVQNHRQVQHLKVLESSYLREALDCLGSQSRASSIKIGLLGHADQACMLAEWLKTLPGDIPVVLDPVIRATDGSQLSQQSLVRALGSQLLPLTHLLTPNHYEARQLSGRSDITEAMQQLLESGCRNILLTGGDEADQTVNNTLYGAGSRQDWQFPRLAGQFHGSGCTLASAAAAYLAQGQDMQQACELAQQFTQRSLVNAWTLDDGPRLPRRQPS